MSLDILLIIASTLVLLLYTAAIELLSPNESTKILIYIGTSISCGVTSTYWYYPTCGLASALFFISPLAYNMFTMKENPHVNSGTMANIILAFLSIAPILGYCLIIADFILNYKETVEGGK